MRKSEKYVISLITWDKIQVKFNVENCSLKQGKLLVSVTESAIGEIVESLLIVIRKCPFF